MAHLSVEERLRNGQALLSGQSGELESSADETG